MPNKSSWTRMTGAVVAAASVWAAAAVPAKAADQVTYSKDIVPIMQRSCQRCHNPNSVAPMSLLTYAQVRPFAKEIKRRTALKYAAWSRGVMPPWFLESDLGIQHMKDDISLSDEEIAKIAKWADAGAPEGNPSDAPPPLKFQDATTWTLGKPDLIVSSPTVYVGAVAADWGGSLGKSLIGVTEDRYAISAEFKEQSDLKTAGGGIGGRFVFHHAAVGIIGPATAGGAGAFGARLPIHEVGRNGDVFPDDAGKLLPGNGFFTWESIHVHAAGTPGTERYAHLDIGLRLHPVGYQPKAQLRDYNFGRTEIQIDPLTSNEREDAYFIAPAPMKLVNFEPHLHATGVRMCLQAIYGRVAETLNCAGYDHNWVRNYQYEEGYEPLIPRGTILHAIAWSDNTPKNQNVVEPRNLSTFGNSSVSNMFIVFNQAEFLTDDQYSEEVQKRKEFLALTKEENIGCPACYLPPAPKRQAPRAAVDGAPDPSVVVAQK